MQWSLDRGQPAARVRRCKGPSVVARHWKSAHAKGLRPLGLDAGELGVAAKCGGEIEIGIADRIDGGGPWR
jgi:hypothetical protein